jgi:methylglutaconyl-CoA hydratase
MSDYQRIRYEVSDGVVTVLLNRPEKRNALDDQTISELAQAFAEAAEEQQATVILLRGAGADFCAGLDLSQLDRLAADGDPIENLAHAGSLGDLFIQMRTLVHLPIIAAVQGTAAAGGAGLATAADLVVAAASARFSYPEIKLGFVPAMVMALLRRVVGEKIAFELAAFGEPIDAEQARDLGLVNRVFPDANFEQAAASYARDLGTRSASALLLIKRLLYGIDGVSFEQAILRGAEINVLARGTPDCREGVQRFLASRKKA